MESHVKVLSWLYIISGILGLIGAACLATILVGSGLISQDQNAINILTVIAIILGSFIVLTSLPGIVAGIGLLAYKPWARILAIILGVVNLPGFPIGTLLGIYTLIVLLDDSANALFRSAREA